MHDALIFIGGDRPPEGIVAHLPRPALVVAADSGFDHAAALGVRADLLVGDLDSISAAGLAAATAGGVTIERHPAAKDMTDTELAIEAAIVRGARALTVVSGGGDRIDHLLGALFAAADAAGRVEQVTMWWATTRLRVLHGSAAACVEPGAGGLFSVLAVGGDASGVSIDGARYPLHDAELPAGVSRGLSNLAEPGMPTVVRLRAGTALVISPDALGGR